MDIFLLCLGFIILPFVFWGVVELWRAYVAPSKEIEAVLKKKDAYETESFSGEKGKKLRLVFEAEERKFVFTVTAEQYAVARVNMRGILTYRGRRFISFK